MSKIICVVAILMGCISFSQSFWGQEFDNYSGIHGVIANPSNVVDSRYKLDIHLASLSTQVGNDYVALDFSEVIGNPDDINFRELNKNPQSDNNLTFGGDILLPSVMFNITKKFSIGVITRFRGLLNLNRANGQLVQLIQDTDFNQDIEFSFSGLNNTNHVWGEGGITLGAVIVESEQHFLKGGLSIKYLLGAGIAGFNSENLSGSYDSNTKEITATGDLTFFSTSDDLFINNVDFNDLASGIGADIGFTYEYRPELNDRKMDETTLKGHNKYRLKIGASILDLGQITYPNTLVARYSISGTADIDDFRDDFENGLDISYTNTREIKDVTVNLPTRLNLLIDYRINRNFYVGAGSTLSLVNNTKIQSNRMYSSISLVPRYESQIFSIYTNITSVQHTGFKWGTGFRFGPFTIGSGSIISNLLNDNSKEIDVYAGIRIPFYQRIKAKK